MRAEQKGNAVCTEPFFVLTHLSLKEACACDAEDVALLLQPGVHDSSQVVVGSAKATSGRSHRVGDRGHQGHVTFQLSRVVGCTQRDKRAAN